MQTETYPRQFVAPDDCLDSWANIEPYFDQLDARDINDADSLAKWLVDWSELESVIDEVGTDRHVKMTCQTDDAERKAAFFDFLENIEPQCKPRHHALCVKYTASPVSLPANRYGVLDRSIRASVETFRKQNVPLQTEESTLQQQYQEICGAQTVEFDGREQTLPQLGLYSDSTDRAVRQDAWEVESKRRLQDVDKLEDIFDSLMQLRHQMATNAGCGDYREYAFKVKQRFDYTPQDCVAFHDAVEKAVMPLVRELQQGRREALGVESLRPWDGAVDVKGRSPLRPFEGASELCTKASRVFHRVDPDLGAEFDAMQRAGWLDLESRKGKAPGGYQATYDEGRHPFIFMNAVGVAGDVRTLIHEGGHAFHAFAARTDPLLPYRSSPIEFAEVASFGMEMLAMQHLDEFYSGDDLHRAKRSQLEGIVGLFPWVATVDAFQHFLYVNPKHTRDERRAHWLELRTRFGGVVDYAGYEEALAYAWHRQLHLFEVPFYYIEYGIAKLGALQVWQNSLSDSQSATQSYRAALALGGSKPLPDLFEAAGAKFGFSYETVAPLMELVQRELAKLPQ